MVGVEPFTGPGSESRGRGIAQDRERLERVFEELRARRHLEAVERSVQPMVKRWFWAPRSQRAVG